MGGLNTGATREVESLEGTVFLGNFSIGRQPQSQKELPPGLNITTESNQLGSQEGVKCTG